MIRVVIDGHWPLCGDKGDICYFIEGTATRDTEGATATVVRQRPQCLTLYVIRGAVTEIGHEERVLIDLHTPAAGGGALMVGYTMVAIPAGTLHQTNWSDPQRHATGSGEGTVPQDVTSPRWLAPVHTGSQMVSLQLMMQQRCARVPTIGGVEQDREEEDDIPEDGYPAGLPLPTNMTKATPRLLQMPSVRPRPIEVASNFQALGSWSGFRNVKVHTIWISTDKNVADDPSRLAQARLLTRTYMMSQIRRLKSSSDDEGGDQGNAIATSFDRYKAIQARCRKADFDEKDESCTGVFAGPPNEAKADARKKRREEAARKPE
jgi:hypothetical protein